MAITIDIIDGVSGNITANGWEWTRKAIVRGLTGSGPTKVVDGWDELNNAGYYIGVGHPNVPAATLASVGFGLPDATDAVEYSLVYRYPEGTDSTEDEDTIVQVGSTLVQTEANKDAAGALLSVSNNGKTQSGLVSVFRPQSSIRISRAETASPGANSRLYVGKVNSGTWTLDVTANARTWMCMSITGNSRDKGFTYSVDYEFAYNEDTWDVQVAYLDPETGRIPEGVTTSDTSAIRVFTMYETANFNNLGF